MKTPEFENLVRLSLEVPHLTRIQLQFWVQAIQTVHGEGQAAHVG